MASLSDLSDKLSEFNKHIWDHTIDPFQMSFDDPPAINDKIITALSELADMVDNDIEEDKLIMKIKRDIDKLGIIYFEKMLQFSGLTRNKILTDLRSISSSGRISIHIPSSYSRLPYSNAWKFAAQYLLRRIKPVILPLVQKNNLKNVTEAINHATWPGWIRQERAKRQGHEAEGRLANIFNNLQIPFEPKDKAEKPMSGDTQLNDVSFDLVVPNKINPILCVKATVHTANIGQYGESKDHLEVDEAKTMLDSYYDSENRPVLLAFIDGVGFHSNRAGLEGVLTKSDEFCQFSTMWKAIVIAESKLNINPNLKLYLPDEVKRDFLEFFQKYSFEHRLSSNKPIIKGIIAGKGIFIH